MLQAIFSTVSGRERQIRRTSSASCMERTVANGTDNGGRPGPDSAGRHGDATRSGAATPPRAPVVHRLETASDATPTTLATAVRPAPPHTGSYPAQTTVSSLPRRPRGKVWKYMSDQQQASGESSARSAASTTPDAESVAAQLTGTGTGAGKPPTASTSEGTDAEKATASEPEAGADTTTATGEAGGTTTAEVTAGKAEKAASDPAEPGEAKAEAEAEAGENAKGTSGSSPPRRPRTGTARERSPPRRPGSSTRPSRSPPPPTAARPSPPRARSGGPRSRCSPVPPWRAPS